MHKKKHLWCAVMMLLIIAFDQVTKILATEYLKGKEPVSFIKGVVRFNYAENTGMAFSLFSGARWVFVALTLVACAAALWYIFSNRCKPLWLYWSIAVVASGGIGNLIDRAFYGYVVDFIEPVFIDFAIFNIADCAVTLGAVSLIAYLVFDAFKKEDKRLE
ncbi:MAG: signal peptidase II [Eubacterium sp.]|nr:signal peptidase II [Eubacterium sp.]